MTTGWNKTAFLIGAYFLIIAGVIFFGFIPATNRLKTDRNKLATKQNELNETYKRISVLQKNSKDPSEFNKIRETVNNYWPDTLDVSHFIVQTENLARDNKLIIENFSVEQPKAVKQAPKETDSSGTKNTEDTASETKTTTKKTELSTQFTFSTKTTYNSIFNLIKGMEQLTRLNSISTINLSGNSDGNVDLRLTGKIYYGK